MAGSELIEHETSGAAPGFLLAVGHDRFGIACDAGAEPKLLAALSAVLPARVDLHCPKIAGHHIYWPAPILYQPQKTSEVLTMRPGTFLFWPERQMLEITYAPLQAESAAVCRLGHVTRNLGHLPALGERVRKFQGRRACFGTLSLRGPAKRPRPVASPLAQSLVPGLALARTRLWAECPAELAALMAGRGVMRPAGPVFFAESELRHLHEWLWWARTRLAGGPALYPAARLACEKAAARLGGFCGLDASADLLAEAARQIGRGRAIAAAALDEAILIAGRLSAWLDLMIPWEAVNQAMRQAPSQRAKKAKEEACR
jgi:hypothetical protein